MSNMVKRFNKLFDERQQYYLADDDSDSIDKAKILLLSNGQELTGDQISTMLNALKRCGKKMKAKDNLQELRGCL